MVDASRVDALLEGLAHRQQAGISMHGDFMPAFYFRHQKLHAAKAILCTVYWKQRQHIHADESMFALVSWWAPILHMSLWGINPRLEDFVYDQAKVAASPTCVEEMSFCTVQPQGCRSWTPILRRLMRSLPLRLTLCLSIGGEAERAYREQMELKAEVTTGGFFMKPAPKQLHGAASWHASSIDNLAAHCLSLKPVGIFCKTLTHLLWDRQLLPLLSSDYQNDCKPLCACSGMSYVQGWRHIRLRIRHSTPA